MPWTRARLPAVALLAPLALAACPADDGGDEAGAATTAPTTTDGATSNASDGSTTVVDPCAGVDLPPCDLCPPAMGTLCGQACPEEGAECSNDIGDGMSCVGGTWQCAVHPPLGEGCNLVCELAEVCTEIGCSDGLTIALVPDGDGVTAGSYVVSLDLDGVVEDCTLEISDDPMTCAGGPPCVVDTTCNALSGLQAMPPEITILVAVTQSVGVSVQRDAEPPVEVQAQPAYGVAAPNGPGCPPACAFATLEVPAL